jgi:hypothetical protein
MPMPNMVPSHAYYNVARKHNVLGHGPHRGSMRVLLRLSLLDIKDPNPEREVLRMRQEGIHENSKIQITGQDAETLVQ